MPTSCSDKTRILVMVTGPSGAGRSSALKVLEDAGYESIDNLPLGMVSALLDATRPGRRIALGVDPRNRDFSTDGLLDLIAQLRLRADLTVNLMYLDCATAALLRRFSETRRRHPMAPSDRPADGIRREQELLLPIRARADVLIDTSDLNVHELRVAVERWFAPEGAHHLSVSVQSFSFKRSLPLSVDMVFDCRFLRNPYWQIDLRALTGRDNAVQEYVAQDVRFAPFVEQLNAMMALLLPAFQEEGKSHVSIAFGCTGGQHRSVTLAEHHALYLADQGWQVSLRHRELDADNGNGVKL